MDNIAKQTFFFIILNCKHHRNKHNMPEGFRVFEYHSLRQCLQLSKKKIHKIPNIKNSSFCNCAKTRKNKCPNSLFGFSLLFFPPSPCILLSFISFVFFLRILILLRGFYLPEFGRRNTVLLHGASLSAKMVLFLHSLHSEPAD